MTIKRPGRERPRRPSSRYITTRNGRQLKIHRSLTDRVKAMRDEKSLRKAERLRGLPKSRIKRIIWRLHPKRQAAFWFSRDGGIYALKLFGIGIIVFFVITLGVFAYFRKDLPDLSDISGKNIGGSIRYYDKTGQVLLWEDYGQVKRIPIPFEQIPQNIKDATLAIEDRNFYNHRGFSAEGIFRASFNNAFGGGGTQGGSTITQQLVKLSQDWTKDRSYKRKIKELILSIELERTYSKNQILTGYLNIAPYGGIEYGVEAAAQNYFHKAAKDLTLDEAAMLASMPQSPTIYSPYSASFNKTRFIARQHYVLDVMKEMGKITEKQRDEAKKIDTLAKVQPRLAKYDNIKAPYFVLAAKDQLTAKFAPNGDTGSAKIGGWKVTTTLDLNLQQMAEEEISKGLRQVQRQRGNTAAFVAEDVRTGQVVAMVGGGDFSAKDKAGEVNFATRGLPPGSSFKPYDYLALIEHTTNFGAGSVLYDTQGALEGYPCTNKGRPRSGGNCLHNYDFRYPGPLTLRYALGGSRNVPAVKAMLIAGIDKTIDTAQKLGLESGYHCYEPGKQVGVKENETQCYVSSAIGDGAYLHLDEHVHAFSSISRNGVKLPQTYILKVDDARGKTIDEWKQSQGEQVVRPESAFIVADIMSDANASYMGNKPHNYKGHKFSVKTGTTNDSKDGWLMGFSTYYSAGVWVGHHTGNVEMTGFMENMTQPIWSGWMKRAHDSVPPVERQRPAGVQTLPAFIVRNHVGVNSREPSPSNDIYPSWYKQKSKTNTKRTIDRVSNKLATDCTPPKARQETTDTIAESFSGDTFVGGGGGNNTEERDDIHKCDDVKPGISFSVTNLSGNQYRIEANATAGTHPLNSDAFPGSVNFTIGGQPLSNCANGCSSGIGADGGASLTFTSTYQGAQTITGTVTDSVLYDNSTTETVDFGSSDPPGGGDEEGGMGGGFGVTNPNDGQRVNGRNFTVEWLGGNGPYTVYMDGPVSPGYIEYCGGTLSTSCRVPTQPSGNYWVYIRDRDGHQTATVGFTKR